MDRERQRYRKKDAPRVPWMFFGWLVDLGRLRSLYPVVGQHFVMGLIESYSKCREFFLFLEQFFQSNGDTPCACLLGVLKRTIQAYLMGVLVHIKLINRDDI